MADRSTDINDDIAGKCLQVLLDVIKHVEPDAALVEDVEQVAP